MHWCAMPCVVCQCASTAPCPCTSYPTVVGCTPAHHSMPGHLAPLPRAQPRAYALTDKCTLLLHLHPSGLQTPLSSPFVSVCMQLVAAHIQLLLCQALVSLRTHPHLLCPPLQANAATDEYMITDNDLLVQKYISVPKSYATFVPGSIVAGMVRGLLDAAGFPARWVAGQAPRRCRQPGTEQGLSGVGGTAGEG